MHPLLFVPGCASAGEVIELKVPAGKTFSTEELTKALEQHKPAVLFLCQGESSTGTHQTLAGQCCS